MEKVINDTIQLSAEVAHLAIYAIIIKYIIIIKCV